jgi:hypothetical protein
MSPAVPTPSGIKASISDGILPEDMVELARWKTILLSGVFSSFDGGTINNPLTIAATPGASQSSLLVNGQLFTGGTSTTTKPLVLIEPSGVASNTWSTSGTMLGINAPSGFVGNMLSMAINGAQNLQVDFNGSITGVYNFSASGSIQCGGVLVSFASSIASNGFKVLPSGAYSWSRSSAWYDTPDISLARNAAGVVEVNDGTPGSFAHLESWSVILGKTTTPTSPVAGQIYFDGTHFQGYNGTTWKQLDN